MPSIRSASEFLIESNQALVLDVRSPKEYLQGHIPGSINMPLFDDDERARIGTLYKQQGQTVAIETGLELVGPKMVQFARFVKPLVKGPTIFVHCWRGGMRSGAVAWLLEFLGYQVTVLKGGYKAYRQFVLMENALPRNYRVIGGPTGSGKTPLLQALAEGAQVVDLEALAHHKGSAFGFLGELPQPTQEQFENNLHQVLRRLKGELPIWIEDESRGIGKCFLPMGFRRQMEQGPLYYIDVPFEHRVREALRCYGSFSVEELANCFKKIERRLGNEAMKKAIALVHEKNFEAAISIALNYYDKAYVHALSRRSNKNITRLTWKEGGSSELIQQLTQLITPFS
ncbi:MAG: tRNA 2-selenouridine(34) synthase MnmH [Chitinophagales bacterium]